MSGARKDVSHSRRFTALYRVGARAVAAHAEGRIFMNGQRTVVFA